MNLDRQYEEAISRGDCDLGLRLAKQRAVDQGFNVFAYHGTYRTFDVFTEGDIGFHFAKDRTCAQHRLGDILPDDMEPEDGRVSFFALSIHNPLEIKCDIECWRALELFKAAYMKVTGNPFESQENMTLREQRQVANGAYRILKALRYDKDSITETRNRLLLDESLDIAMTDDIRNRFIESRYDGIVYVNDFEATKNEDPTCYIVFQPNQIKTLEPTYEQGVLITLSQRFDKTSSKFTH